MKKALVIATVFHFLNFEKSDIKILLEMGYEVHTATNMQGEEWLRDDGTFSDLKMINHQIDFSRSPFSRKSFLAYRQLKQLMNQYDFSIIHCHTPVAAAIARVAAINSRKVGTYVIYTCHGFHFNKKSGIKSWVLYYPLEKLLAHHTDMIITINKEDFEVVKGFKVKEKRYIPGVGISVNGIAETDESFKDLRKQLGISENDFVIMTIGELSNRKNQQVILKAISKLNDKNIKYVLCGTGKQLDIYKRIINDNKLNDQVIFTGQKDHDWVMKFAHCIDLGAIPSKIEGLGLAGIEMLAAGKPLVGSNIQGINDYLINEKTGLSFSPTDINGFAQGIYRMKNDKKLYETCSSNAYDTAKKFDIAISRDLMKKIYEEITCTINSK